MLREFKMVVKKKKKIRKNKAPKPVVLLLLVLVCAGIVYFAFFSDLRGGSSTVKPVLHIGPIYPMAEELLKKENSPLVKIKDISFTATNDTASATAGGLITYRVKVSGFDEDKNPIEVTSNAVTVTPSDEFKLIRQNTLAVYETEASQRQVNVTVKFGEVEKTYSYNVIKQDNSNGNLAVLVNKYATISEEYVPQNLTQSDSIYYTNGRGNSVSYMAYEASIQLEALISAAEDAGYTIYACSGYRDYDTQRYLYNRAVANLGEDQNDTAKPGTSEHQTGLAMDLIFPEAVYALSELQEDSGTYRWMQENAHNYGFVLRYPKGFEDLTGYMFEPWHWRYIGVELATQYHQSGMDTLDEFMSVPRTASFK